MKNLILLITALFASVSYADLIPGGAGSPTDFPSGFTYEGSTFFEEGTYTPTFSNFSAQITSIYTPLNFRYQRIGNWVYVSGEALIDQGGSGEGFAQLTLPIASTLNNGSDLVGTAAIEDAGFKPVGNVRAIVTPDNRAQLQIETSSANNGRRIHFNFRYYVQ